MKITKLEPPRLSHIEITVNGGLTGAGVSEPVALVLRSTLFANVPNAVEDALKNLRETENI